MITSPSDVANRHSAIENVRGDVLVELRGKATKTLSLADLSNNYDDHQRGPAAEGQVNRLACKRLGAWRCTSARDQQR
jgi:hypothetical protein